MKPEDIVNAMSSIDEDLIQKTEEIRSKTKKTSIYRICTLAACFCICIGCTAAAMYVGRDKGGNDTPPPYFTETAPDEMQENINEYNTDRVAAEDFLPPAEAFPADTSRNDMQNDQASTEPQISIKIPEGDIKELPDITVTVTRIESDGFYATIKNSGTADAQLFPEKNEIKVIFKGKFYLQTQISEGKWKSNHIAFNENTFSVGDELCVQFYKSDIQDGLANTVYSGLIIVP